MGDDEVQDLPEAPQMPAEEEQQFGILVTTDQLGMVKGIQPINLPITAAPTIMRLAIKTLAENGLE